MTDDYAAELDAIAGSVPSLPSSFAELRSLIQSLPSPLAPEVRSAQQGQVSTTEPGTSAQQIATALAGGQVGTESGAVLGVVSEIFYGNANALGNPLFDDCETTGVALGVGATDWGWDWRGHYVLNAGALPATPALAYRYDGRSGSENPFNSSSSEIDVFGAGGGATDLTAYIYPRNLFNPIFDTALPYLVASVKVHRLGTTNDANTTTFRARMEILQAGVLAASGPWFDLSALNGTYDVVRLSTALALPASILAVTFTWRLRIDVVKSSAGGLESLWIGEPSLALASTQASPPFAPIIGKWKPSELRTQLMGDNAPRLVVGGEDLTTGSSVLPGVRWSGGAGAPDVNLTRAAANVLRLTAGSSGTTRAALEVLGSGVSPGAASASSGRLWWSTATSSFHQVDSAGVDTDLAAAGGGPATQVSMDTAIAGAADYVARIRLGTDATYRAYLGLDSTDAGMVEFGGGAGARDVRLRRSAAGALEALSVGATNALLAVHAPAGQTSRLSLGLTTDAIDRIQLQGDATAASLQFGAGGASTRDLRLIRSATAQLNFDDNGTGAAATLVFRVESQVGQRNVIAAQVAGDTAARLGLGGDATLTGIELGSGAAARDWQLARDGANSAALASGDILNLSAAKLTLPVNTTAEATEGRARWVTASDADGAKVVVFDSQRERVAGSVGWQPFAYQPGGGGTLAYATTLALPISGGSLAIPIAVDGHMLLNGMSYRISAASGTGEWRLYKERLNNGNVAENTLDEVSGANGTIAALGAAGNQTSNTAAAVYLAPGLYWLVLRCTSGATALNIGTQASGVLGTNTMQTKTIGAALGATLDFVTGWAKSTAFAGVVLRGRVFGQTAVF